MTDTPIVPDQPPSAELNVYRHAAVLVVAIGPRWAEPPLGIRLDDDADWVRQEILLAQDNGSDIIPVLVDQPTLPDLASLPGDLQFLASLQAGSLRQGHPRDVDLVAQEIVALLPTKRPVRARTEPIGVARTRDRLDTHLRQILPPAQQWWGNREYSAGKPVTWVSALKPLQIGQNALT